MKYNILSYLETAAERWPEKKAVTDEKKSYTYGMLWQISRRIGTALAKERFRRKPVAVMMEKGADTLCAFLGIVWSGNCYSLLNPELPEKRLRQLQAVLEAPLVITDAAHREAAGRVFPENCIRLVEDLMGRNEDGALLEQRSSAIIDTDPLYVNFTSGSAGTPKGVAVGHRSVMDFTEAFTETFQIRSRDIIGNQAPFDFDVSVKDIYSAMRTGASLVIIPKRLFSHPALLLDYICRQRITVLVWAVSALCLISALHGLDYLAPHSVRVVLFSGEVMPRKHLAAWMEKLPEARFVNLYGPTEITCNCTWHEVERGRNYEEGLPLGRPFPNERVFLLDEKNHEVTETGAVGEICVAGTALALGYYNEPEQTARAFVHNPLQDSYPERIYRTGDLGRYGPGGELFFCGRKDFQIKYMGHRIELEEIERAMDGLPGVERGCCVYDADRQKIRGFYTGQAEKKDVHTGLRKRLPAYMIPGELKRLDRLPVSRNGKLDRRELAKTGGGTL